MLDSVDPALAETLYRESPGKRLELRLKSLQWAGKLGFPTITGFMVGIGESEESRRESLQEIARIHAEYGTIHEVLIQNFVPEPNTPFETNKPPTHQEMLAAVELARELLPEDIPVTVPVELNQGIGDFIRAGVRDFPRVTYGQKGLIKGQGFCSIDQLQEIVQAQGFTLQRRFPLRQAFIQQGRYSKKLGQVFDHYRYKIKKDMQEKMKEKKV